jgi:expansin
MRVVVFCVLACGCSAGNGNGNHDGSVGLGDLAVRLGDGSIAGDASLSAPESGVATYYDADGTGACSFDATSDLDVAAIDMPEWNGSAPCGECVAVAGPKGDVTVRIVDLCPGCETGHLDLSMSAFAKIADVSAGRVPITWHVVPCAVSGDVQYRYKEGSSQYWTAIQVRNSRLAVSSLELMTSGAWQSVMRSDYDYFVDAAGAGSGSLMVRITAADGEQLVDTLPPVQSALVVDGSGQF